MKEIEFPLVLTRVWKLFLVFERTINDCNLENHKKHFNVHLQMKIWVFCWRTKLRGGFVNLTFVDKAASCENF